MPLLREHSVAMEAQLRRPTLVVSNISKRFGERERGVLALSEVSLEVFDGEFIVLLGPSGCGKSTLLRLMAGLEIPSTGSVQLDGVPVLRPSRDQGMVFQGYTSFPWLTVQQNIEYGMRLNGVSRQQRRARAEHYLELVGLEKFRDAWPKSLSGGMKQRVAIARTLANDPRILLMDEPFGALDAETRWSMQELLLGIMRQSAATTVMVTHDIDEAIFLADRIVFMSKHPGRVREILPNPLKRRQAYSNKADALEQPEFAVLRRKVLSLMREANQV